MTPLAAIWINWVFTSTMPVAAKAALPYMHPVMLAWLGALAGLLYFLPAIIRNKWLPVFCGGEHRFTLLIMGAFGSAFPIILFVSALNYTTPANAAILAQIEIVYSLLMAGIFLGERPCRKQLAGTFLVMAGTFMIAWHERFTPRWKGDLLVLCAPWMYQLSHIAAKKLPQSFAPEQIAAARAFYAFITMTPIALFGAYKYGWGIRPDAVSLSLLAYWGLVLNGLNMVLWYRAIRNMDLAKATAIILSYPVMTTGISVLTGMDTLALYQVSGLVIAMAGAYWVTMIVKTQRERVTA